jgi:hypothetical protein
VLAINLCVLLLLLLLRMYSMCRTATSTDSMMAISVAETS